MVDILVMIEVLLLLDSECNCCSCDYYDDSSNDDNKYQLQEHFQNYYDYDYIDKNSTDGWQ